MPRRVALVAVLALALAVGAAPADAQSDAGERQAQAHAYAAAAIEFRTAVKAAKPAVRVALRRVDRDVRCMRDALRAAHLDEDAVPDEVFLLVLAAPFADVARAFKPGLDRFVDALAGAPGADRILTAGRGAWTTIARTFGTYASLRFSPCALLRTWGRAGFRPSARPPVLDRIERLEPSPELERDIDDALSRAGLRMIQLGARSTSARAFAGRLGGPLDDVGADPFFGTTTLEDLV